jgi:hypothetical protein
MYERRKKNCGATPVSFRLFSSPEFVVKFTRSTKLPRLRQTSSTQWSEVCFDALRPVLYATPPDSNVVIDVYPDNDRIIIASPCLGLDSNTRRRSERHLRSKSSTSKVDISSFSLKSFRDLIH